MMQDTTDSLHVDERFRKSSKLLNSQKVFKLRGQICPSL